MSHLPLVVSLTTLPSRIGYLKPTLDSLLCQTRPPDKILLCLPERSIRENAEYARPAFLPDYEAHLEVVDCRDDFGPGTKLLGALPRLSRPACLVLVDDDMIYKPFFLDGLYKSQIADFNASFSYYTFQCGPFRVGQGADGFSLYSPYLDKVSSFAEMALSCHHLRMVDDLWLSAYLKWRGISVRSIQHLIVGGSTAYEISHRENQLQDLAGDLDRELAMTHGVRYLLESGSFGRIEQFRARGKRLARHVRGVISGR